MLIAKQEAGLRIGMWINMVVKNFRGALKPIVYPEIGLQVDIPKVRFTSTLISISCESPASFPASPQPSLSSAHDHTHTHTHTRAHRP